MKKIASPQELTYELRSLIAYSESPSPSRAKLSSDLQILANRIEADEIGPGEDWGLIQHYEKVVRDFARKVGADSTSDMGMNQGIHMYFNDWRDADARPSRVGFSLMTLYKKYGAGGGSFGIYTAFNDKSKNRILTKELYSPNDAGLEQAFKKFAQRLRWTEHALEKMKADGVLVPNEYLGPHRGPA